MISSEFSVNLFSRSEVNKFALSKSDIARKLSGLCKGGILFVLVCFLLLSRESYLSCLEILDMIGIFLYCIY